MPYLSIVDLERKLMYEEDAHKSILEILRENNISFENPCSGKGTCGKCKVKVIQGTLNEITVEEKKHISNKELLSGVRLSCYAIPKGDVLLELIDKSKNKANILSNGYMPKVEFKPRISKKFFKINNLGQDNRAFEDILEDILESKIEEKSRMNLIKKLPEMLSKEGITVVFSNGEIIDLEIGNTVKDIYGIAIDIGTTTMVASLVDLSNGNEVDVESELNPQKKFGLDVISRMEYARNNSQGLKELHGILVEGLNNLIERLCCNNGICNDNIYEITVGANASMMHFLLEISTYSLGQSPYNTIFNRAIYVNANSIGIKVASSAMVYCINGVSSYIGADIVAGVVVSELYKSKKNVLFIDIGTNGEIVLCNKGKLCSCSCAAGPALEGMNIESGMRAAKGAIESIRIKENGIELKVIGNEKPIGICGSGILEGISELIRTGLVGKTGRLIKLKDLEGNYSMRYLKKYLNEENNCRKITLSDDIFITQNDIRQVQLAKGAILSGFYSVLEYMNMTMEDLDQVIIAGQFGKHLSVDSLLGVGLLPKELGSRINYIGNSSKTGAMMCLISEEYRRIMEETASNIEYLELSTKEGYDRLFAKCMSFS